jgi:hypothetical protein
MGWKQIAGGYAKYKVEEMKRIKEDAIDMMKENLSERRRAAMVERKAKEEMLEEARINATSLMDNYGFNLQQVGVLATQGRLEEVNLLYKKADLERKEGVDLPDPSTVVRIAKKANVTESVSDYLRGIVIGDPIKDMSRTTEQDLRDAGMSRSAARAASAYEEKYMKALGDAGRDMDAYAYSAFNKAKESGAINLQPLAPRKGPTDDRTAYKDAKNQVLEQIAGATGLDYRWDDNSNFIPQDSNARRNNAAIVAANNMARKVVTRAKDIGFSAAMGEVTGKLSRSEGGINFINQHIPDNFVKFNFDPNAAQPQGGRPDLNTDNPAKQYQPNKTDQNTADAYKMSMTGNKPKTVGKPVMPKAIKQMQVNFAKAGIDLNNIEAIKSNLRKQMGNANLPDNVLTMMARTMLRGKPNQGMV